MKVQYQLDFLKDYYGNDEKSMKVILRLYMEETPKELDSIENFLLKGDAANAKSGTHKIKTNIAMLGIRETEMFTNAMHHLKPGDDIPPLLLDQFRNFRTVIESALKEIREDYLEKK